MKQRGEAVALGVVFFMWGLHLGYPMHHLQDRRWLFWGHMVPIYYFFTVSLMLGAALLVLSAKRHWKTWELLWWLLPLICLPGIIFSDDRLWSLRQWLSWIIRGVIPGGVIFLAASREKSRALLTFWIYPIVIAASLLGLSDIFFHYNPLAEVPYTSAPAISQPDSPFYRAITHLPFSAAPQGTQTSRIPYASLLAAFFPLGLWFVKYQKKSQWAHILAFGVLASILILAQVRSVWLATAGTFLLMVAVEKDRKRALTVMAGMALCLGLFLAVPKTREMLWPRLNSFHLSEGSIEARLDILQTVAVLKGRWWHGIGMGQFPTAARPYYQGTINWYGTPDNQYFRWLLENGVPSLVLLGAFFIGLIRAGWEKIRLMADVREADFYKALLFGWLSIAMTFLFFDGFYWGACNMTFWCLLGLFAACLRPAGDR